MSFTKNTLNTVAFESASPINIWGKKASRLMAVYRTRGCSYDKDGNGCNMCNFSFYADDEITDDNILKQHWQVRDQLLYSKFAQFDLLTLGNFFNDEELSEELRHTLLESLSSIKTLHRVLVESRYDYLTTNKLLEAKKCLRQDQQLEFGLGYETVTESLRNGILNKGFPERNLDSTLSVCEEVGVDFVAYVLIKPYTLNEKQGIKEAVDTALHVLMKAKQYRLKARIAFEPVFVSTGKEIEKYFLAGAYVPPRLWSVIEVLRLTTNALGADYEPGSLFVGLSDENLSCERFSSNCLECDDTVRSLIQEFNGTQRINKLISATCHCKKEWRTIL